MKKINGLVIIMVLMMAGSLFGAPAYDSGYTIKDIAEKEWLLSEFTNAGRTVRMDRQKLTADNMGNYFTLLIKESTAIGGGQISGIGAPNRYFAPFSDGSNRMLNVGLVASTMMAAFREPDGLKEGEYFAFLSCIRRWDLKPNRLELYGLNSNGAEVILVFTQN